jgi:hypothetical protein
MAVLDPIRNRYTDLAGRTQQVRDRLEANAEHCRKVTGDTILKVKGRMGLSAIWKI